MSTYHYWREFAATWGSLYFAAIFVVAVAYALWPSKGKSFDNAAQIPFIED